MLAGVEIDKTTSASHPLKAATDGTIIFKPSAVIPVMKNRNITSNPIILQPFAPKL